MIFSVPLLVIVNEPPFVVTTVPFRVTLFPVIAIPPAAFVFIFPLKREVPLPADWVRVAALISLEVRLRTLLMIKLPRRVVAPKAPLIKMSPVPAASVRFPPPSTVFEKVIFWFAAAVVISTLPETVTACAKESAPPEVICPAKALVPVPVWLKAPEEFKAIPDERVKSPEFAMEIGPDPVAVALALKVKLVPFKLIPALFVVLTAPLKVVVPVPLLCVKKRALMA